MAYILECGLQVDGGNYLAARTVKRILPMLKPPEKVEAKPQRYALNVRVCTRSEFEEAVRNEDKTVVEIIGQPVHRHPRAAYAVVETFERLDD